MVKFTDEMILYQRAKVKRQLARYLEIYAKKEREEEEEEECIL